MRSVDASNQVSTISFVLEPRCQADYQAMLQDSGEVDAKDLEATLLTER